MGRSATFRPAGPPILFIVHANWRYAMPSKKVSRAKKRTKGTTNTLAKPPAEPRRVPTIPKKETKYDKKRRLLRDQLWPDSKHVIWSRLDDDGYTTIPRLLPLVTLLIRTICRKGDPSKAYWELWCFARDPMIVSVVDEEAHAFAAGYTSTRAVRTWRENIWELEKLGFIRVMPDGNRDIGHILIVNPIPVCQRLYNSRPQEVTKTWWNAFIKRGMDIGAIEPEVRSDGD